MANPDGHLRVIFASSAFGLGIDGRGISTAVHTSCPRTVDDYVQEVGRGGRGGLASAIFANASKADDFMKRYCDITTCRRAFVCEGSPRKEKCFWILSGSQGRKRP